MAFVKLLMTGDAASPSDNTPASVGTTAAAGTGAACSRDDHVHDLGTGCIDAANLFAAGVVDAAAIGADAVEPAELQDTGAFTMAKLTLSGVDPGSEIVITPKVSSASTTEGTLFYDADDDHLYVYTAA